MFKNIGSKIKSLAEIICWIGIVISVLIGIAWMENSIIGGILIAIIGSGISWIGSFFAYGFGELIEKTSEIATNISCFNNGPKLGSDGERHRSLHHIDDGEEEYTTFES